MMLPTWAVFIPTVHHRKLICLQNLDLLESILLRRYWGIQWHVNLHRDVSGPVHPMVNISKINRLHSLWIFFHPWWCLVLIHIYSLCTLIYCLLHNYYRPLLAIITCDPSPYWRNEFSNPLFTMVDHYKPIALNHCSPLLIIIAQVGTIKIAIINPSYPPWTTCPQLRRTITPCHGIAAGSIWELQPVLQGMEPQ